MAQSLKKKNVTPRRNDKDKERVFRGLSLLFSLHGFKVRREELKRGPGWNVSNGSCRKIDEQLIFVDRRSSIDDQIGFLAQCFVQAGLSLNEQMLSEVPEDLRPLLLSLFNSSSLTV